MHQCMHFYLAFIFFFYNYGEFENIVDLVVA